MSHLTTCEDSRSATSSPELASGLIPCVSQDGLTINQSGPAPARASLSARQAKEMGLLTSGTFGPTSSTSSASADLSMSLANRLQAVTQTHGSTLYKLTWKEWDTPSGLCRLRQRASVLRTSESGPTGWPTPTARSTTGAGTSGRMGGMNIQTAVTLTGWPTPQVNNITNATTVQMSGDGRETPNKIGWAASLCGPLRLTVFGEMRTGSYVEMANGVQLNPAHSRWLMGLPRAWDESSPGWQEWQAATASADSKAMVTP
ncbi:hypothetical protein P833_02740 [Enterobacter hormaechei]|nr:hypothetical protein P833_02740 [Enterobacter hormaechei]